MEKITFNETELQKMFTQFAKAKLNELAKMMSEHQFPVYGHFKFSGKTVSKTKNPELWIEEDEDGNYFLRSNLVEGKPRNLYVSDLLSFDFVKDCHTSAYKALNDYLMYKEVEDWIEHDQPCVYRSGWGYRGAGARRISKEKAQELLPKYSFGKGFYELSWITIDGEKVLEFNELSENDMW